ncbi:hypothetical protein LCM28_09895 [Salipiger pacificus]|nr:hypothetical protein [Alloyangia pacifica]
MLAELAKHLSDGVPFAEAVEKTKNGMNKRDAQTYTKSVREHLIATGWPSEVAPGLASKATDPMHLYKLARAYHAQYQKADSPIDFWTKNIVLTLFRTHVRLATKLDLRRSTATKFVRDPDIYRASYYASVTDDDPIHEIEIRRAAKEDDSTFHTRVLEEARSARRKIEDSLFETFQETNLGKALLADHVTNLFLHCARAVDLPMEVADD